MAGPLPVQTLPVSSFGGSRLAVPLCELPVVGTAHARSTFDSGSGCELYHQGNLRLTDVGNVDLEDNALA